MMDDEIYKDIEEFEKNREKTPYDALFDKYSFSDAALQGSRPKRGERFRFSCCPTSVSGLTAGFGCRVVPYRFEQSQIVSGSFRLLGSVPSFFKLFCTASGCLGMFRAA